MATPRILNYIAQEITLPVTGAVSIAQGDFVFMTTSGHVTNVLAASRPFMGIAKDDADNTAGAAGALNVKCIRGTFEASSSVALTRADLGKTAWASNTTGSISTASGSNANRVGVIEQLGTKTNYFFVNTERNETQSNS